MYDNMNTELKSNVQNHNMNKQESKNRKNDSGIGKGCVKVFGKIQYFINSLLLVK
jgi:hypothetical protein